MGAIFVCVYLFVDAAGVQGFGNVPVDQGRYALHKGGGVLLHAGAHPFQRQADKGVLVKIGNELLVLLAHRHASGYLLHHADHQIVGHAVEVALDMLAAD